MDFEPARVPWPANAPLVLVLVAPRLLDPAVADPSAAQLVHRLQRLKGDLALDGFASRFVLLDMERSTVHRDGAGVLAIRAMLQDVRARAPGLAGILMIGDFPEAMLVRSWAWRRTSVLKLAGITHNRWLRIEPEIVAERSDIVLADLTGRWDQLYVQGPSALDVIRAVPDHDVPDIWPARAVQFRSAHYERFTRQFQDFFHIRDDRMFDLTEQAGRLSLRLEAGRRNPELGPGDLVARNPIARPEIHVSRINARHIACDPQPLAPDLDGRRPLDAQGRPQIVNYPANVYEVGTLTVANPALERRLLIDHLDRNHRWRNGQITLPGRAHVIAYPLREFAGANERPYLAPAFGANNVVTTEDADLAAYAGFLKASAPLKMVVSHCNGTVCMFKNDTDGGASLERAAGGRPWRWQPSPPVNNRTRWTPSLAELDGAADIRLYRTLWSNALIGDAQAHFLIHRGCQVNSPEFADTVPYSNQKYGRFQNAESQLFYTGAMAMLTRAKLFNDKPDGAVAAFSARLDRNFGDGLAEYFRLEAQNAALAAPDLAADCKRSYTWSIIGDWSLRLKPIAPAISERSIDAAQLRIVASNGRHFVRHGNSLLLSCDTSAEANRAVDVLRHYRIDRVGYVNQPKPSLTYWLTAGQLPSGRIAGDDVIPFDRWLLTALQSGGRWVVATTTGHQIMGAKSQADAEAVIRTLRRLEANAIGYVGRPHAAMVYLLR